MITFSPLYTILYGSLTETRNTYKTKPVITESKREPPPQITARGTTHQRDDEIQILERTTSVSLTLDKPYMTPQDWREQTEKFGQFKVILV